MFYKADIIQASGVIQPVSVEEANKQASAYHKNY